jgi:aminoglycoside phosphotransferase (APT) family kinase protein
MTDQNTDDTGIARGLLDLLRQRVGAPHLEYARAPERIPGGYDTRIFAFALRGAPPELSGPLILRLYRRETDASRAAAEAAIHRTVAALGYPCPPALLVGEASDGLAGGFLVLPRVPGHVLLDESWGPGVVRMPGILARLHVALHALDPAPLRHALASAGIAPARLEVGTMLDDAAREVAAARLDGMHPVLDWLATHRPPETPAAVICHGDFHPLNVLVENGSATGVIDWANLRLGEAAYDVGATLAILSNGPVDAPFGLRGAVGVARRFLVNAYRRAYLLQHPLAPDRLRYYEALRTAGFVVEAGVYHRAAAGAIPPSSKPSAFASPRVLARAMRRVQELTGVAPRLG